MRSMRPQLHTLTKTLSAHTRVFFRRIALRRPAPGLSFTRLFVCSACRSGTDGLLGSGAAGILETSSYSPRQAARESAASSGSFAQPEGRVLSVSGAAGADGRHQTRSILAAAAAAACSSSAAHANGSGGDRGNTAAPMRRFPSRLLLGRNAQPPLTRSAKDELPQFSRPIHGIIVRVKQCRGRGFAARSSNERDRDAGASPRITEAVSQVVGTRARLGGKEAEASASPAAAAAAEATGTVAESRYDWARVCVIMHTGWPGQYTNTLTYSWGSAC